MKPKKYPIPPSSCAKGNTPGKTGRCYRCEGDLELVGPKGSDFVWRCLGCGRQYEATKEGVVKMDPDEGKIFDEIREADRLWFQNHLADTYYDRPMHSGEDKIGVAGVFGADCVRVFQIVPGVRIRFGYKTGSKPPETLEEFLPSRMAKAFGKLRSKAVQRKMPNF
jgi:hypothetical protein